MPRLQSSLPMMLNRTLDGIMPAYRELFARYDLTEQQWRILRALWEVDEIRSADLAAQTLLPKPSLVGILDRLENRGYVERRRSTTDRRSVCVAATAAGKALSKEVLPQAEAIHAHLRRLMSDEEWAALQATLADVTAKMEAVTLAQILPAAPLGRIG